MKKLLILWIGVVLLSSCASVEKYNRQIVKLHSAKAIHEDIDESYEILQKLHPRLYWFISKDSLDLAFNNLKKKIDKPMSSYDFYKELAPVIGKIRQGHTSVGPPFKKMTRQEKKLKGKRYDPFKRVRFTEIKNKIYVKKVFKDEDSTLLVGSEVLSVNNEKTKDLLNSFDQIIASDGYNKTFAPRIKGFGFGYYYQVTHERKDTIQLNLKFKDSIYTHYLVQSFSKLEKEKTKKITQKKLGEKALKIEKVKKEAKEEWEEKVGYVKYSHEQTRTLEFIQKDSIQVVYMKIRRFKNGDSEVFYEDAFKKIDSAKVKHLIIDLRDNLGGSLPQVDDLYSYLTDKEYVFVKESEMNSRFSYMYPIMHTGKKWITTLGVLLYPLYTPYFQIHHVRTRHGQDYFRMKYNKKRQPKENNYKGKIYVIINGTSFSASSVLSTHLHATKRALFIGEETGGAYNATIAGFFAHKELPNTKVGMRFGIMSIETPYKENPDGFGIKPDVFIPTTRLDTDEQLNWILNNLDK